MAKLNLSEDQQKKIITSLKRISGQIKSIQNLVEDNNIDEGIFAQLLAVKGGASRVCKDIIMECVLGQIEKYSKAELEKAIEIILKLDK